MVDCSHANSNKDPSLQPLVAADVADQIITGNRSLIGLMIESNIEAGKQGLGKGPEALRYGVSITDGCIGWDDTARCLRGLRERLKDPLRARLD
jgi:3-deoxy-7-phosphoheptulonate synthase